jgi:hypothetical protein
MADETRTKEQRGTCSRCDDGHRPCECGNPISIVQPNRSHTTTDALTSKQMTVEVIEGVRYYDAEEVDAEIERGSRAATINFDRWQSTLFELGLKGREIERLQAALSNLRNEVGGILGTVEHELRAAAGNTNLAVLRLRYDEANAALRAADEDKV